MTNEIPESVTVPNALSSGHSTRALVLDSLFRNPGMSRAEMARRTGLSRQTVGEIVAELERHDLVRPVGQTKGAIGRPATENVINGEAVVGLAIDLGGSNLRVALIDLAGDVRAQRKVPTPATGLESLAVAIETTWRELCVEVGMPDRECTAVAIGIPGVVHPATGIVRLATNLPYLNGVQFGTFLEERLGVMAHVDNDVNLAAIGEWLELSEEVKDFVFLSIGTGIGMALVLDGRVRHGATGSAGEVAGMPVATAGKTLEEVIGARAIEARLGATGRARSVADVLAVPADQLGADARALIDEITGHVAEAICGIVAVADPEVVVLGGGIGLNEHVLTGLHERFGGFGDDLPPIRPSRWGDNAGVVGAAIETARLLRNHVLRAPLTRTNQGEVT